jgi:hypothetical protein
MNKTKNWLLVLLCIMLLIAAVAAWWPLNFESREELFEIPPGTWERRMSGDSIAILPEQVHLALGVRDILVLRNSDSVPQIFGPTLIMPGQSFKLPFEQASDYQFVCTAHASGQMTVIVDAEPVAGWLRLRWRAANVVRALGVAVTSVN